MEIVEKLLGQEFLENENGGATTGASALLVGSGSVRLEKIEIEKKAYNPRNNSIAGSQDTDHRVICRNSWDVLANSWKLRLEINGGAGSYGICEEHRWSCERIERFKRKRGRRMAYCSLNSSSPQSARRSNSCGNRLAGCFPRFYALRYLFWCLRAHTWLM